MGITKNPDGRVTIFIGHGGNPQWKDLELYLRRLDRFNVINFESGPRAGFATKEVLKRMLDEADIAFLIHTAEDEVGDQVRARENVVHEAGLFQGRLGFERAIIVLEQGCHEYSNIVGVSQIRFPKGQIKMAFSEIRDVIDREFSQ